MDRIHQAVVLWLLMMTARHELELRTVRLIARIISLVVGLLIALVIIAELVALVAYQQ
jgi:hypothetical protein